MMWCQAPGRRLLKSAAAFAVVLTMGACDFPTEAPIFTSRYVIPSDNTTLAVNQLLPSSVSVVGSAFQLALAPVTLNRTLGSLCTPCTAANGLTVPYPGFTATVSTAIAMPTEVASATLTSGSVSVAVTNNFGFDPLSPSGATSAGTMTINVTNGTRTLGSTVVNGPFPSGTTKTVAVPLAPGTIAGPINIDVAITSPSGTGLVTINTNNSLSLTATPVAITIGSANVAVSNKTISATAIDLNLSDIDESISKHAVSGAIIMSITNPFTAGGTLQLKITGNGVNITKNVVVTPATSATTPSTTTQRVEFTGSEIRQMLGQHLTLTISGPVNASGATVTVAPGQALSVATSLDLVIQVGGTVN